MIFFLMGLAVACFLTFLVWCYFYDINIDLKDQLEYRKKQFNILYEQKENLYKRKEKERKEYQNCKLQLEAYESEISRLKNEKYKLESQLKHKIVEHRIIQVLPKSVTLRGKIRKPQRLELWDVEQIDNMTKRIIAKDLVNQIVEGDLIQINTEIDPKQLEDVLYYELVVQKKD